ncbi:hypothetical protein FAZ69_04505 [Trinickia terrae]|uniref:Uncharacterized protein n=1 Tax=Trinickia terrae TaxID=2571161 RepID=A0A4U1IDI8_9BURK|nr:hypothetical protein [Trinickia terrae]TKC91708.1 hypothetical protein FAZ69_04505 [Trinickia terrae]
MRKALQNPGFLLIFSMLAVGLSVHADLGKSSWAWFQRSGAIVTLAGALLGYRSVIRLGRHGVGGASMHVAMGKLVSIDDSGPIQTAKIKYDEETIERFRQDGLDKVAGYLGAWMIVLGTAIWAYGDLLGQVF